MSLILLVGLAAPQAPPPFSRRHVLPFPGRDVLPVRVHTRESIRGGRRYGSIVVRTTRSFSFASLLSLPFIFSFPNLFVQNSYSRFFFVCCSRQISGALIRNWFVFLVLITGRSRRPFKRRAATIGSRTFQLLCSAELISRNGSNCSTTRTQGQLDETSPGSFSLLVLCIFMLSLAEFHRIHPRPGWNSSETSGVFLKEREE